MTADEIANIAKSGGNMPKGLMLSEQLYFQAISYLIIRFRIKAITAEQVVAEKQEIDNEFFKMKRFEGIYTEHQKIRLSLCEIGKTMYTGECETCKKFIRLFHGLDMPIV